MPFANISGFVGNQAIGDIYVPNTTQQHPLGSVVEGVDPFFGWGKFVYAKAAAAQEVGSLCFLTYDYIATDIPNTANTGYPIVVAKAEMASGAYGWYQTEGMSPWSATASVAIGVALGITGAGQVGANSAGKQVLSARVVQPGTYAFTKAGCVTTLGSGVIKVPDINGVFNGLTISGTGVPASTEISAINPNQNEITGNNVATASGAITLTFTYTGFLLVQHNSAFVQGAIT